MAITTAFQAVDTGSIPVTRSIREIAIFCGLLPRKTQFHGGFLADDMEVRANFLQEASLLF